MSFVRNANSKSISMQAPSVPNVYEALTAWFQNVNFIKIKKKNENFELVETNIEIAFQGVVEAVTPKDLQMKPEGQRKWDWINVWSNGELDLNVDEVFRYREKNYRIVTKNNWVQYGYQQFEACEDYQE